MQDTSMAQFSINADLKLLTNIEDTIGEDSVATALGVKSEDVGDEFLSTFKMKLADQSDPVASKSLALVLKAAENFELPIGNLKAEVKDGYLMLRFISQVGEAIPGEIKLIKEVMKQNDL